MTDKIWQALATGLVGAGIGWASSALTLSGRVEAIEKSLVRIEARLYPPAEMPAPPPKKGPTT